MKKVCIVGAAPSWKKTPFEDASFEIWTLNHKFAQYPRITRHFDVHIPNLNYHRNFEEYSKWLKENQGKLYILGKSEEFPSANVIDWLALVKKYGVYFTSSMAYMIALAIEEGFQEIQLYGVECNLKLEYEEQKPCLEYFIGIAKGKGIKVYIHPTSKLLKSEKGLYGF